MYIEILVHIYPTFLRQNEYTLPGGYYIMDNPYTLAGTWYCMSSQITKFMGPTWGPPGSCRPQMVPMLVPRTLLSGTCPQFTSSIWWMLQPQTPGRYPSTGSCGEGWNLQRNTHVMTLWHGNARPDSKVHGANMGPIWILHDPGGPHVSPMNLTIWVCTLLAPCERFAH